MLSAVTSDQEIVDRAIAAAFPGVSINHFISGTWNFIAKEEATTANTTFSVEVEKGTLRVTTWEGGLWQLLTRSDHRRTYIERVVTKWSDRNHLSKQLTATRFFSAIAKSIAFNRRISLESTMKGGAISGERRQQIFQAHFGNKSQALLKEGWSIDL